MGIPSDAVRRQSSGLPTRLTERELATLAEQEAQLAATDPQLIARVELLWSLAAFTQPSPPTTWKCGVRSLGRRQAIEPRPARAGRRPRHLLLGLELACAVIAAFISFALIFALTVEAVSAFSRTAVAAVAAASKT